MSVLQLLTVLLYAAAVVVAVTLARKELRLRPLAIYLAGMVAVDLLRWGRALLLPAPDGPRVGWELALRHGESLLYLVSILALPTLARVVFARRGLRPSLVALGFTWAWSVVSYPELRGEALMAYYLAIEAVGVLVAGRCFWVWLSDATELPTTATSCTSALLAGGVATVLMPLAAGQSMLGSWLDVVAINACMIAAVLFLLFRRALTKQRLQRARS